MGGGERKDKITEEEMKRILVIGCAGAGKSTFSRKLASKLNLPLYHLDMLWWNEDRTTIAREEFDRELKDILEKEEWIIDGNYKRTLAWRLEYADTVFFLDFSTEVCLSGAIERLGKERPDIPWIIDYEIDEDFKDWIMNYRAEQLPIMEDILDAFQGRLIRFTNRSEADKYLDSLQARQ